MQNIRDNGAKSSINFQRCDMKVAPFHNAREAFLPETSHPELVEKNECSCSALAALKKIKKWDAQADEAYLKTYGQKSALREKNKVWECVINLRENHTLKDVKKLTKKLEKMTGYRAAQIAIHKDEGHYEEGTGDFIQNVHAHVIFYARDIKTGLSLSAKHYGQTLFFEKIQDLVAQELGMERGQSAEITGAKHMSPRAYKAQKRQEAAIEKNNSEWEAKMAEKQAEWEVRKAEWEAKLAEREAKREEWEKKIPEIIAARERRSKYICEQLDWENARTGKMLAREMQILGMNFAGIANPNGNILVEAQKHAIRNVFYMLGATAQLAVFLMKKTLANDEKLAADAKIYNVESTLIRAVDYVANSDPANAEELKKRIKRTLMTIPADKQEELFAYALENAPTPELKADIKALVEGRFEDIAKSEAAQRRIENRDLRQALKEYAAEAKRIRDELREMEEENRILNLAERALLKDRGANREEYADQEAANRKRLEEIKGLKDEVKRINNELNDQKQREQKDAETIKRQAAQIKELTDKIAKIGAENVAKQRELEQELEAEKAARKTAETLDAFDIIDKLEKQKPEPEPKIEPEPKKADDKLNIYGYPRPAPEPRRRFDDIEPRRPREIDDRPRYVEPEKIEPEPEPEPFRDPWQKITDEIEKWKKCESEVEKKMLSPQILRDIEKYEKSGWDIPIHRQMSLDGYRRALAYDPADAIHHERERKLETERKRQQAEMAIKYEEVKTKSVKQQEDDARQTALKKKRKDEYEMGMS